MGDARLTYDGTTYHLVESAVADLVARGVIVPDPLVVDAFDLSPAHLIQEIEPFASSTEFRAGEDARGESVRDARKRVFSMSFQYHRDGQGH